MKKVNFEGTYDIVHMSSIVKSVEGRTSSANALDS